LSFYFAEGKIKTAIVLAFTSMKSNKRSPQLLLSNKRSPQLLLKSDRQYQSSNLSDRRFRTETDKSWLIMMA
jgi:hypothetical protein